MLMHRQMKDFSHDGAEKGMLAASLLTAEVFTPLSERVSKDNAIVTDGLANLKLLLTPYDFECYIESLLNVRQQDKTVWMVVDSEMQRSIMERNLMPSIQKAFGLLDVRILVSQA